MWEWSWVNQQDNLSESESSTVSLSSSPSSSSDTACRHIVTCKCIGYVKNLAYQNALAQVSKHLSKGETVPVKLLPELLNPVDTQAVTFICELNGEWRQIGYVI